MADSEESQQVVWWLRWLARGVGTLGGVSCAVGAILTFVFHILTPLCIAAAVFMCILALLLFILVRIIKLITLFSVCLYIKIKFSQESLAEIRIFMKVKVTREMILEIQVSGLIGNHHCSLLCCFKCLLNSDLNFKIFLFLQGTVVWLPGVNQHCHIVESV